MNYQIYIKLFFLIPIILIFLIIRFFKDFRINRIISKKIGHMSTPMEIYICEKKDDPSKIPVIWFFDETIANEFLKKKWSEKLFILPRYILEPIYTLFKKYKFFSFFIEDFSKDSELVKRYLKDGVKQIDNNNVLSKYKPSIEFNNEENKEGENYLKKIGLYNKKYFTFASRTSEFHNENEDETRNTNINNKILGLNFMISKGYKAIRMGKNLTKKINFNNENIIDYSTSGYASDFLDFYIISKCDFMISASTGITTVAALFRKPSLIVNEYGVHALAQHPNKLMIILKKFKNLNSDELISFEEAYQKKLNYVDGSLSLKNLGYKLVDNDEIEIKKAAESFYNLINNNLNIDEILYKQKNYWQNVEKYFGFKNKYKTIICPHFYSTNIDLFE